MPAFKYLLITKNLAYSFLISRNIEFTVYKHFESVLWIDQRFKVILCYINSYPILSIIIYYIPNNAKS